MRIGTNIQSMIAIRRLQQTNSEVEKESLKLSSGDNIVKAAYDPAGLAISEKMKSKIRGISQIERNINDGISLLQIAEGSLGVISEMGIRLKELALQSATDTISNSERSMANVEFQHLKTEISRLAQSTKFNGNHLLNEKGSTYDFQVGLNNVNEIDRIRYNMRKALDPVNSLRTSNLNITTKSDSQMSMGRIDRIFEKVSQSRANIGGVGNRMTSARQNVLISRENISSANSAIRDTDVASSSTNKLKTSIMSNATIALLAQANSRPELIMKLVE